jgi:hypothetical protein
MDIEKNWYRATTESEWLSESADRKDNKSESHQSLLGLDFDRHEVSEWE